MTSREQHVVLPPELASVRTGRTFARDAALAWGLDALADDVQLGVSELITNAVRHAGTPLTLTVRLDGRLIVEVRDDVPDPLEFPAPADPLATSGRGLHIVAAVSHEWGVRNRADGKCVWFAIELPDRRTDDADVFDLGKRRAEHETAAGERRSGKRRSGGSREMHARAGT